MSSGASLCNSYGYRSGRIGMLSFVAIFALSIVCLRSADVRAEVVPCKFSSAPHAGADVSSEIPFRINPANALLAGMSESEFIYAVLLAAETWNAQANVGYLKYLGKTAKTWSRETPGITTSNPIDCDDGYSLVMMTNNPKLKRCQPGHRL
jgi:hypothetical protein